MRVVCISDTHCAGGDGQIVVPEGDLLIHAGDLTFRGNEAELESELGWLDSLPHQHKVVCAGNHDWFFDSNCPRVFRGWRLQFEQTVEQMMRKYPTLTYLCDSGTEINGLKVYGSPWQPYFYGWAFNFPEYDVTNITKTKWAEIPSDTNILVTHGPPRGILDATYPDDARSGCPELWKRVEQLEALRLHVFGHLHESYGRADYGICNDEDRTVQKLTFVNASIMTREYVPLNLPIVVDL